MGGNPKVTKIEAQSTLGDNPKITYRQGKCIGRQPKDDLREQWEAIQISHIYKTTEK